MIYHGDYKDFNIKADVVITEPLYLRDSEDYESYISEIVKHVRSPVMVFFQPDWRPIPRVFDGWVVSDVNNGIFHDYLVHNIGYKKEYKGFSQKRNPRPYEVMRAIVEEFSKPGDVIYDPFMGYGSTGLACEGREFIGVEKLKKFFDICTLHSL